MDYGFYVNQYKGTAISETDWPVLCARAEDSLRELERVCRVSGGEEARCMALCAMAEVLSYFTAAQNGKGALRYASVGSVSVSGKGIYAQVDISPEAERRELRRAAGRYLTICRAAG